MRETHIADAWRYEQKDTTRIMSRNQTIYDAIEKFMSALERGTPRIYALLITERGNSTEKPLGIITPWDLLPVANP